jgi:hypothetical protein
MLNIITMLISNFVPPGTLGSRMQLASFISTVTSPVVLIHYHRNGSS